MNRLQICFRKEWKMKNTNSKKHYRHLQKTVFCLLISAFLTVCSSFIVLAEQQLDPEKTGSLTLNDLSYTDPGAPDMKPIIMNNGEITVYKVSDVAWREGTNGGYIFDISKGQFGEQASEEALGRSPEIDKDVLDTENFRIATVLSGMIKGKEGTSQTIKNGSVSYTGLTQGLYLVVQTKATETDDYVVNLMSPFLISIPYKDADGKFSNFDVTASPKPGTAGEPKGSQTEPPKTPEKHTEKTEKPTESETPNKTTPSGGGGTPTTTPSGGGGGKLPQTGQLWWPVWILAGAGVLLILIGLLRRKSSSDDQ